MLHIVGVKTIDFKGYYNSEILCFALITIETVITHVAHSKPLCLTSVALYTCQSVFLCNYHVNRAWMGGLCIGHAVP